MAKVAEFLNLSIEELAEKAGNLRKELMQYRFQLKTGKLERQSVIQNTRRDIARILTVMRQKKSEVKS
ncbi:MAG: 50S ribosomal protein L29 [Candidatus Omnitrophica bacterium]|nr:50S ribosomal protein L29 [Candidatus Omnitrophota bacterium]